MKIQAPRGTYDVLPDLADERARLERTAAKILERAGYGRIETPTFEATQLFSRTVGEATDVVQKEMYTFPDGSGDSLTLRPEGTAPVVRSYLEHGMHKAPQPVKLWYLSNYFRYERPQAGRYRQFWQIGVEAIGSADPAVDAEVILLLAELLEAIGARDVKLVLATLGQPESRAAYREELKTYLRANEDAAQPGRRRADRPQPAARVRRQARADPARDGERAAADRPAADTRISSTSPRCRTCCRRPGSPTPSTRRSCAGSTTTRARCSSSSRARWRRRRTRSAAAAATTGWRRRSAVRRRRAWAGPRASSGC